MVTLSVRCVQSRRNGSRISGVSSRTRSLLSSKSTRTEQARHIWRVSSAYTELLSGNTSNGRASLEDPPNANSQMTRFGKLPNATNLGSPSQLSPMSSTSTLKPFAGSSSGQKYQGDSALLRKSSCLRQHRFHVLLGESNGDTDVEYSQEDPEGAEASTQEADVADQIRAAEMRGATAVLGALDMSHRPNRGLVYRHLMARDPSQTGELGEPLLRQSS